MQTMQTFMGSILRRLRIYYINHTRMSRSILIIGILTILYWFNRLLLPGRSPISIVKFKIGDGEKLLSQEEIQGYIDALQDTRPVHCRDQAYEFTRLDVSETISIVMDFHGKQFYDLQLTLSSVVEHTPFDLYKEIVVIDDGTDDVEVRREAAQYLQNPRFSKVKLYRSETVDGQAATRFKASQLAHGSIIIYVSSAAVVNHGWIQPLIAHVSQDESLVAVPHADNLLAGHVFYRTDDRLVSVFSWSLFTLYTEDLSDTTARQELLVTPVMRGDVFAVKKSFLEKIGNFDEKFYGGDGGAGHHLELSLRAWMCGGKVKISQCSRVAVHNALRPQHVTNPANYRRIVDMYFSELQPLAYYQGTISSKLPDSEAKALQLRRAQLKQLQTKESVKCQDFAWYLSNVATYLQPAPTDQMVQYGKVKAKTNYCLRVVTMAGGRMGGPTSDLLDMGLCRQHIYDRSMMFELNTAGRIFAGERCIEPDPATNRAMLSQCSETNENQRWRHSGARLEHIASRGRCLAQVTASEVSDTGIGGGGGGGHEMRHYATVTDCATDPSSETLSRLQSWEFIRY